MMEALTLAAALFTADATARDTEVFACWCEVSRFPDPTALREMAYAHKSWLEARQVMDPDINPNIAAMIDEQEQVIDAYRLIAGAQARPYAPCDWDSLRRLRAAIGDDDYFAGRLPLPVTCQRQ